MNNHEGFVTLTPAALQRTCYVSEQDRLNEFAKALRVPIQTGEIIKGDQGEPGKDGIRGPQGAKGQDGADGTTPALSTQVIAIDAAADFVMVTGDIRASIVNLAYNDETNEPPSLMAIQCIRFNGTQSKVYFDVPAPDALFQLHISSFS